MSLVLSSVKSLTKISSYRTIGKLQRVRGLVIESLGPRAALGSLCVIKSAQRNEQKLAEVVGFNGGTTLLMALEDMSGLSPGDEVQSFERPLLVGLSNKLLGRVLNGLGEPIDSGAMIVPTEYRPLTADVPHPLSRMRVQKPLSVGVKAVDGLLTIGQGQRVGIFSGSGVGKSNLLGMMARYTEADVVVIGLVGERGREINDFIEKNLGKEGLAKSVIVTETSDSWPLLRIKAAMTATTIAEYFRDQGLRVLLLMDSVSRVCYALREVGLSLGEPPATKGYPPSVFATLPKLLERAGNSDKGSITGIYTVLVEGDDMMEPVADAARSILDGHIVLSRKLASRSHYPAIDVLQSVSRLMPDIISSEQLTHANMLKEWLAVYAEMEDLISVGAYMRGTQPKADMAIDKMPLIEKLLRQQIEEPSEFSETAELLRSVTA